jgi:hypothetical protein
MMNGKYEYTTDKVGGYRYCFYHTMKRKGLWDGVGIRGEVDPHLKEFILSFNEAAQKDKAILDKEIQDKAQGAAALTIQATARRRGATKQVEAVRTTLMDEHKAVMKQNKRDHMTREGIMLQGRKLTLTGRGDEGGVDKTPACMPNDYAVQQCGPTCWFMCVTTFLVKNVAIRNALQYNDRQIYDWLSKLHYNLVQYIVPKASQQCTLQTQQMCLQLPLGVKYVKSMYDMETCNRWKSEQMYGIGSGLNERSMRDEINRGLLFLGDEYHMDRDKLYEGSRNDAILPAMLGNLLVTSYDGIPCVAINHIQIDNSFYGSQLVDKIQECTSELPISILYLSNPSKDCKVSMFEYLQKLYMVLTRLDSNQTICGGVLSLIRFSAEDQAHSGHAMTFSTCIVDGTHKINVIDTGMGVNYSIWWDNDTMKTDSISEEDLIIQQKWFMALPTNCYHNHYPSGATTNPVLTSRSGELYVYEDLLPGEWSSITRGKHDGGDDLLLNMWDSINNHVINSRESRLLVVVNYSTLQTFRGVAPQEALCQPFRESYMKVKHDSEAGTIDKELELKWASDTLELVTSKQTDRRKYRQGRAEQEEHEKRQKEIADVADDASTKSLREWTRYPGLEGLYGKPIN